MKNHLHVDWGRFIGASVCWFVAAVANYGDYNMSDMFFTTELWKQENSLKIYIFEVTCLSLTRGER